MKIQLKQLFFTLSTLLLLTHAQPLFAAEQQASSVPLWEQTLRDRYFPDSNIKVSDSIIQLDMPKRAEDPALVPIRITANFPQSADRYIEQITLIVDRNPDPLAGVFTFSPKSGKADLELRLRVDQYTDVRAIAKLNSGELFMTSGYIKASGGCSAPSSGDLKAALARLGKIKMQTRKKDADGPALISAQLRISHPNITGMQKNQMTHLYYPPHFVNRVRVTLDDQVIFQAKVGISISENPSFKFYLREEELTALGNKGALTTEVFDSKENRFVETANIGL